MTPPAPGGHRGLGLSLTGPVGFDLDLTLIDSQAAILAAWAEVARGDRDPASTRTP